MYVVEIMHETTRRSAGPIFFAGSGEQFVNLTDAINEAKRWIDENCEDPGEWKVLHRIVGCL